MKKTTRILTVLAFAASSVLFATPSQAASVGAADVAVSGTLTTTTLSANSLYYTASSNGTRDTLHSYWWLKGTANVGKGFHLL